jgi:rod shape-determining protein MreD
LKYFCYTLSVIAAFILQTTVLQNIAIMDIKPNVMLILVVCIGFIKGGTDGLYVGIISGLLHDCYYSSYIGSNLFLYSVIGYFVGSICNNFYKENILAPMITTAIASFCYDFLYYVINILLKGYTGILYFLRWIIVPSVVYNCLFSFIIYMVVFYTISFYDNRNSKYRI